MTNPDNKEFTFRQWNPEKKEVSWGEPNGSSTETSCPMYCITCYLVEWLFKTVSQETIDYCRHGSKTSAQVFTDLEKEN